MNRENIKHGQKEEVLKILLLYHIQYQGNFEKFSLIFRYFLKSKYYICNLYNIKCICKHFDTVISDIFVYLLINHFLNLCNTYWLVELQRWIRRCLVLKKFRQWRNYNDIRCNGSTEVRVPKLSWVTSWMAWKAKVDKIKKGILGTGNR